MANNYKAGEPAPLSFYQKEQYCESLFIQGGPYWHICTPGDVTEILFTNNDDFKLGMTAMAISMAESNVISLTDALMSNHIHIIAEGTQNECLLLFERFKKRLARHLSSIGRFVNLSRFVCSMFTITDLRGLRNEIIYTNRNGYVVNHKHTPFSYPWGSGNLYFNQSIPIIHLKSIADLSFKEKRAILKGRVMELPQNYKVMDGMIMPISYSGYARGELFFRDAHQYFNLISKNFEAYSEIARHLGDSIFLADDEMYSVICQLCKKNFDGKQPNLLQPDVKIEIAREIHSKYNASNGQIQRMLKLDKQVVDTLFPLKSK